MMRGGGPVHERIRLGPGGEFDLIRSFLERAGTLPKGVRVGPGDDCAVLDAGQLALSTDLSVEDVHFKRAWLTPEEIGWRASASALSDLAAVAAEPLAILVSLALPEADVASGWARRLMDGLEQAARECGAGLVGGDVSRSFGPAVVDVVAVGRCRTPVLRSGAKPGDEVWVTGELGAAAAGLRALREGKPLPDASRRAFAHPLPRVREAVWLEEHAKLHALIDLSDGLGGDAAHLAAASGVAVEIALGKLPVAPGATVADALGGGEDYELCVVAAPRSLERSEGLFDQKFNLPLTRIGHVRSGEGVWVKIGDAPPRRLERGGFSHFEAVR
jgi:thiamine-monophosphate kinase